MSNTKPKIGDSVLFPGDRIAYPILENSDGTIFTVRVNGHTQKIPQKKMVKCILWGLKKVWVLE